VIDLRITLARADLAPVACEGMARAAGYARLRRARASALSTALRSAPDPGAEQASQLLFGEAFDVLRESGTFSWGQSRRDGYVGWVETAALDGELDDPTHWVRAPRAPVLREPKVRAPTLGILGMSALVRIAGESGAFSEVSGLGWVATPHLAPVGSGFGRPPAIATMFLGTPYVWGGRDGAGLDCSGLIQQSLYAAGLACPRDADQQSALGRAIAADVLVAGDLVVWRGHIGMMLDAEHLIHANAHHMAVTIESLAVAVTRIEAAGSGPPIAYRRL
jgi:hypothetical protein